MIARRVLLALAIAAGVVAAGAYALDARRVTLVVAAHDLEAGTVLAGDDLASMAVPAASVPSNALTDASALVGRTTHVRLGAGQLLLRDTFEDVAAFRSGLRPPPGSRAVALPVSPALALGGALAPGMRVDVVAVPVAGRAPADRGPERLGSSLLVLDVRSEAGGPFVEPGSEKGNAAYANARIGSVVVAVPADEDLRVAERIATSTFILLRPR